MRASGCARMPAIPPVLLKIAPDLSLTELDDVVHIARSRRVDGMIVANTTLARPSALREQAQHEGAGRIVRTAAVSPLDAHGGGDLCARRGRVSADRRRRHRFRRRRADEDPRRRQPDPALFVAGLQGPRPRSTTSRTISASTLLRTGRDSLSEIVGADAATITAEDWPVV